MNSFMFTFDVATRDCSVASITNKGGEALK
jgi:hypothetical protein